MPTGGDAEREAGRLSMDEVRSNLAASVLPRLASERIVVLRPGGLAVAGRAGARGGAASGARSRRSRAEVADVLKHTGEHPTVRPSRVDGARLRSRRAPEHAGGARPGEDVPPAPRW